MQRIYREYLYGYSTASIAKRLTEECIPTPSNKTKWYPSVILSILRNEKYYGALICGKTFKPDVVCGACGSYYRRHAQYIKGEYTPTWVCATLKLEGNEKCNRTYLKESEIEGAFIEMIKVVVNDFQGIRTTLRDNIVTSLDDESVSGLGAILGSIEKYQSEMLDLVRAKRIGNITEEEYNRRGSEIEIRISELSQKRELRRDIFFILLNA